MLGYIKAYKPELKVKDYEIYKGIYCTLCKKLGKRYSPLAQLLLSYDFTFLLLLKISLSSECPAFKNSRCQYNPLVRCKTCTGEDSNLNICADTVIIMAYYKIIDNIYDGGFLKKIEMIFVFPVIALMHKKAKRLSPEVEETIALSMKEQKIVEAEVNCGIDMAAEPTAKALSTILALDEKNEQKRIVLKRLGYLVGRWVYIMDAVDDLEDDIKGNCFNPLKQHFTGLSVNQHKDNFNKFAQEVLDTTAGEAALAFELLETNRFRDILENILYDGLARTAQKILNTERGCEYEKSV